MHVVSQIQKGISGILIVCQLYFFVMGERRVLHTLLKAVDYDPGPLMIMWKFEIKYAPESYFQYTMIPGSNVYSNNAPVAYST